MQSDTQLIMQELKAIQEDLNEIRKKIAIVDLVVTDDDQAALEQAENDLKHGKTKRLI